MKRLCIEITEVEYNALKVLARRWWPRSGRGKDFSAVAAKTVLVHGLSDVDNIIKRHTAFSRYCIAEGLDDGKAQRVLYSDRVRAAFAGSSEVRALRKDAR